MGLSGINKSFKITASDLKKRRGQSIVEGIKTEGENLLTLFNILNQKQVRTVIKRD